MKRINYFTLGFLMLIVSLISCSKNNEVDIPQNIEVNDFVWKGMNSWYNWQSSVPNLADSKNNNSNEYFD